MGWGYRARVFQDSWNCRPNPWKWTQLRIFSEIRRWYLAIFLHLRNERILKRRKYGDNKNAMNGPEPDALSVVLEVVETAL